MPLDSAHAWGQGRGQGPGRTQLGFHPFRLGLGAGSVWWVRGAGRPGPGRTRLRPWPLGSLAPRPAAPRFPAHRMPGDWSPGLYGTWPLGSQSIFSVKRETSPECNDLVSSLEDYWETIYIGSGAGSDPLHNHCAPKRKTCFYQLIESR